MRIAIANAGICMSRGGAERSALRLSEELRKRGHDTRLLTVMGITSLQYAVDSRIPIHFFPNEFFGASPDSVQYGAEVLRHEKIDIMVSLESDWKHLLWLKCAVEADIPFICSERTVYEEIEDKLWNRRGRYTLLSMSSAVHQFLPIYFQFIPEGIRNRAFAIPHALPDEKIPDKFPTSPDKSLEILYLGRFVDFKRPWILLEAFALLSNEFPQWRLKFVGGGPEEARLKNLVNTLNLHKKVEILPSMTDVDSFYSRASIYCLPTSLEGFGLTTIEAMSHGLPIVGIADSLAMQAIVKPGITGVLATEATAQSLADTLRPLMQSEELRQTMGRNAWEDCRANYCDSVYDRWDEELQKVVDGKREESMSREEKLAKIESLLWRVRVKNKINNLSSEMKRLKERAKRMTVKKLVRKAFSFISTAGRHHIYIYIYICNWEHKSVNNTNVILTEISFVIFLNGRLYDGHYVLISEYHLIELRELTSNRKHAENKNLYEGDKALAA